MTGRSDGGWLATARVRYFGSYPLIENDEVRSDSTFIVNLKAERDWGRFALSADLFNLLNSKGHDIDYFYASRLPGEPEDGVEDIHFHSLQPRSFRLAARYSF